MCSQKIMPNIVTYSTILKGYCNERSIDKALELLEDMKKTMEFRPDEITYNTLLDGCARMGLYDRGVGLLRDMEEQGVEPSNFTLSVVAKLASRSRLPDKAFELCEEISHKYHIRLNVHVYNNLVQACTTSGDNQRALNVFEQMLHEKVRPDARTYTLLLRGCISTKQAKDAASLLRAAVGLRGAHPKLAAFGTNSFQLRGELPTEIITEILESISNDCGEKRLAVELARELRTLSNIKLDPKVQQRQTSTAINITAQP
jgi:pentatricopeptide repeat protein